MVRAVEMRTVPTWGEGDYIIFFSGHAVSNCGARITNFFIECLMVQAAVAAAVAFNVKTGQDYSPAGSIFSDRSLGSSARWGVH